MSDAIRIRPFALRDLRAAARFGDAARALDPAIEPFTQRLGLIATGPRAELGLWRVAEAEDGGLYGLSFAALRASAAARVHDFYAAVHPSRRRQGIGRALAEAALESGATLRARVRDDASPGIGFLRSLGFEQTGAQLSLQWSGTPIAERRAAAVRIRRAAREDQAALQALSTDAWEGVPDAPLSRADEIAQLFAADGQLVLLAECEDVPAGYLSAVQLGRTVAIEELAVLPRFRRRGVARALVLRALSGAQGAVLSVAESNQPGRALYRALGFQRAARRLVMERRPP